MTMMILELSLQLADAGRKDGNILSVPGNERKRFARKGSVAVQTDASPESPHDGGIGPVQVKVSHAIEDGIGALQRDAKNMNLQ